MNDEQLPSARRQRRPLAAFERVGCRRSCEGHWRGWATHRIEDLGDEQPELAFNCPDCVREQFGH